MTIRNCLVILMMISYGQTNAAPIQKWTDNSGKVHYGSSAPNSEDAKKIKNAPAGNPSTYTEEVTLYATSWCGYCKRARAYMARNGIQYKEYDIEKDRFANARYKRLGGRGIPFLVKGDEVVRGFNTASYDRFFGL